MVEVEWHFVLVWVGGNRYGCGGVTIGMGVVERQSKLMCWSSFWYGCGGGAKFMGMFEGQFVLVWWSGNCYCCGGAEIGMNVVDRQ